MLKRPAHETDRQNRDRTLSQKHSRGVTEWLEGRRKSGLKLFELNPSFDAQITRWKKCGCHGLILRLYNSSNEQVVAAQWKHLLCE